MTNPKCTVCGSEIDAPQGYDGYYCTPKCLEEYSRYKNAPRFSVAKANEIVRRRPFPKSYSFN